MKSNPNSKLIISVGISLSIAVVGYSLQFLIFEEWFHQQSVVFNYIFRLIRMILGYLVPSIYFLRSENHPISEMGLRIINKRYFLISLITGIVIYLVPSYVFLQNDIFTSPWKYRDWGLSILLLFLIGAMAAITDLWTRGFVLLQFEKVYGVYVAIFIQNAVWFLIHVYEIILIMDYIGLFSAILLTLFLGIMGDIIVIKTKNVAGLMIGHVMLNLMIILQGKGITIL